MIRLRFVAILLITPLFIHAQRTEREFIRKANRLYSDSLYIKAEEFYLKALDKNSNSIGALYNLGNAYLYQQKVQEAAGQYEKSADLLKSECESLMNSGDKSEKELKRIKEETASAYHNIGVVSQGAQDYRSAVEAYKEALRNNPSDNETRYNLALALHQLKNQEQQQNQQQEQQQDQQNQNQDQKDNQQQNKPDDNQQQDQNPQNNQSDISRENAEQILEALMQDEKDVQERVNEQMMKVASKGKLEKDW